MGKISSREPGDDVLGDEGVDQDMLDLGRLLLGVKTKVITEAKILLSQRVLVLRIQIFENEVPRGSTITSNLTIENVLEVVNQTVREMGIIPKIIGVPRDPNTTTAYTKYFL